MCQFKSQKRGVRVRAEEIEQKQWLITVKICEDKNSTDSLSTVSLK